MTKTKKYELTFTMDIQIAFYDKNYHAVERVFKAGEKITATFIGVNEWSDTFRNFKCGKHLFAVSVYTFDSIRV